MQQQFMVRTKHAIAYADHSYLSIIEVRPHTFPIITKAIANLAILAHLKSRRFCKRGLKREVDIILTYKLIRVV